MKDVLFAFARPSVVVNDDGDRDYGQTGMSLRDYFASKCLGSGCLILDSFNMLGPSPEELRKQWAKAAYAMADAMLLERNKNP